MIIFEVFLDVRQPLVVTFNEVNEKNINLAQFFVLKIALNMLKGFFYL